MLFVLSIGSQCKTYKVSKNLIGLSVQQKSVCKNYQRRTKTKVLIYSTTEVLNFPSEFPLSFKLQETKLYWNFIKLGEK